MIAVALRPVYCDRPGCKLRTQDPPKEIGWTDGRQAKMYCGSCRAWTWWRA